MLVWYPFPRPGAAETKAAAFGVNAQDAQLQFLPFAQVGTGVHAGRKFGKVNKSLNAILNAGEGPERGNLGDGACDDLTGDVALLHGSPGIDFGAFDGQGDFFLLFIDTQDLDFNFLADFEYFAGMIDAAPGELADMNQSVCASQVNKCAKVGEVTDHTMAHFAWFQLIEQFFTAPLPPFLSGEPLGEDQAVSRAINLDDLELELLCLSYPGAWPLFPGYRHPGDLLAFEVENLRDWHEPTNTGHIDNQATFIVVDDSGLEQFVILILLFRDTPLPLCICPFEREKRMSVLCFRLNDIDQYFVIQVKFVKGPIACSPEALLWKEHLRT